MLKKTGFKLLCLAAMVSFLFIAQAQTEEQGWKKTITLPSGEVVCDLNGEWVAIVENYGPAASWGNFAQMSKITQTGSSFVAIRMIDDPYSQRGAQQLQGELDKSGIKKVRIIMRSGKLTLEAKGQISDDGNKMVIDSTINRPDGVKVRQTYTRK